MSLGRILVVALILVVITTVIHSISTRYILLYIKRHLGRQKKYWIPQSYWISVIVILLIIVCLVEATIWAVGYMNLGAFNTFEESIYFSLASFTALGAGETTLNESFRLLSGIEAANGIILFGWSTAIVIALVQRIYFNKNNKKNENISTTNE